VESASPHEVKLVEATIDSGFTRYVIARVLEASDDATIEAVAAEVRELAESFPLYATAPTALIPLARFRPLRHL
jgi:hypothetical protein